MTPSAERQRMLGSLHPHISHSLPQAKISCTIFDTICKHSVKALSLQHLLSATGRHYVIFIREHVRHIKDRHSGEKKWHRNNPL